MRRCRAVFERDRRREAVAERCRVGEHHRAAGAELREVTAVAATVADRAADEVEVGLRLAEGEAGDLDERALGVEHAARRVGRVLREAEAVVGAHGAVFGLGAHVEREDRTGAEARVGRVDAVVATAAARDELGVRVAGLTDGVFGADPAADLDAGIGSGNVEEPGAVDAANLHVFYWFGTTARAAAVRSTWPQRREFRRFTFARRRRAARSVAFASRRRRGAPPMAIALAARFARVRRRRAR